VPTLQAPPASERPDVEPGEGQLAEYLASLLLTWRSLLHGGPGADVVEADGWFAARSPDNTFTNGVFLKCDGRPELARHLRGRNHAIWTLDDKAAAACTAAGLPRHEVTVPMVCNLPRRRHSAGGRGRVGEGEPDPGIRRGVAPAIIENLNSLTPGTLRDVPGLSCYATDAGDAGLAVIARGVRMNVSMVFTEEQVRRRGLSTRLLEKALTGAAQRGVRWASLQATESGRGVYERVGFVRIGTIVEYVP